MKRFLCHPNLLIRFLSLLILCLLLFIAVWTVSYLFLPEGILRGRTGSGMVTGQGVADSFLKEFLTLFSYNLIFMVAIVAANRVLQYNGYPFGYLPMLLLPVLYGIILGTNSFSIPLAEPMAPSFAVLRRSGLYEMAAYILMAAATYRLPTYRVHSFIPPDSEKLENAPSFRAGVNWTGFLLALLFLIGSNGWEAYSILRQA